MTSECKQSNTNYTIPKKQRDEKDKRDVILDQPPSLAAATNYIYTMAADLAPATPKVRSLLQISQMLTLWENL